MYVPTPEREEGDAMLLYDALGRFVISTSSGLVGLYITKSFRRTSLRRARSK